MSNKVLIVDYGVGNIFSVAKKVRQFRHDAMLSNREEDINAADKLILPGVGDFGVAMRYLRDLNLVDVLYRNVFVHKKPILGICLGMQLLANGSAEDGFASKGLGWVNSTVERFNITNTGVYKIPHIGWKSISIKKDSKLLTADMEGEEFYYTHSYHMADNGDVLATSFYEYEFVCAVEQDHVFGVQFHPEKSHDVGMQLFKNFLLL